VLLLAMIKDGRFALAQSIELEPGIYRIRGSQLVARLRSLAGQKTAHL